MLVKKGESKMPLDAKLVEKTAKDGTKYVAVEITIYNDIKKLVFLTQAEKELIRLAYKK